MNEEEVRKLAALARIRLTDEEVARYVGEFQAIIGYVKQLDGVASGPTQVGPQQAMGVGLREDVVFESTPRDAIISQFPERDGDSLRVPKVLHYEE